ncbi:uroporphyrinogen-III synthase [Janibacter melonis]|uniref:uroporphyrinogen-III synthase n=1 Tax=Janibacter melonis TaxID=262209 RepID=UPI00178728EA|nr:uroporphyrinogen-III synthase [Janibacter melonis]MBD5832038.1 uroporphyrinogen-III synthase [Janibacter melonis]
MSTALPAVLAGCVVLVTADRRSADLAAALERRGASVRHAPALTIVPHTDDAQLLRATRDLVAAPPDVLVVTTGVGFRGWLEAADAGGLGAELHEVLAGTRVVARGPKAKGAIMAAGLTPDWVAESETSAEILRLLLDEGVSGLRVAIQHHGAGADGLDVALADAGADVAPFVVYRWGPPRDPEAVAASVRDSAAGAIDCVVFTSAPGAQAWLDAARGEGVLGDLVARAASGDLVAAAVGPVTAAPLREAGIEPVVPERGRLGALVRAVLAHYSGARCPAVTTVAGELQVRGTAAILGERVLPLSPSGLAVLRALVDAQGAVVSREQLLGVLPGDSTDPHAAEVAVSRVREAAGRRDLVQTVVKRGYRLGVPV